MIRLQRKIAHLQNVLDRRYTINNPLPVLMDPMGIPVVLPVVEVGVPEPEPDIPLWRNNQKNSLMFQKKNYNNEKTNTRHWKINSPVSNYINLLKKTESEKSLIKKYFGIINEWS